MRILVLGGYGFIGAALVSDLLAAGHDVVGLGRDTAFGARILPDAEWRRADISKLSTAADWAQFVSGVDAIVNAAGALQDGARDSLKDVHATSIAACVAAAESAGVKIFVQISAPGAAGDASTAFMKTKATGDAAVRASSLDWVIFKPGLVIGPNAYGGTALLRMLAATPFLQAVVHGGAKVQTVYIGDVADAVRRAVEGRAPMRADYDLVEETPHALRDIVASMRAWMGRRPALVSIALPNFVGGIVSVGADIAGNLGWRSPLRSTALKVMGEDVVADPAPWRTVTGAPLKSFAETLRAMPATAQERLYGRMQWMIPVMVLSLSAFWIASGVVGMMESRVAAEVLTPEFTRGQALATVYAGAIIDIIIGALFLLRRTARLAAGLSALVATGYVLAATHFAPELWFDPLGVLMKVLPCIVLSVVLAMALEER